MRAGDASTPSIWERLSADLRQSAPYRRLRSRLGGARRLPPVAAAWVLYLLAQDLERPVLAIVPREADALAWVEGARLVTGDKLQDVVYFPTPALTPYQEAEPSLSIQALEVRALDRVIEAERPTVVCTPRALFQRLPTSRSFAATALTIRRGGEHPLEPLAAHLVRVGYRRSDLVTEVGVFAVRGGVFDVFPPAETLPIRLDMFGDEVESIRRFDPTSQRSLETLDEVRLQPLSIYRCGEEEAIELAQRFEELVEADDESEAGQRVAALARGDTFAGWQNYLPLLLEESSSLLDLLGDDPLVVAVDRPSLRSEVEHHRELLESDFEARRRARRLAVPPELLLESPVEVAALIDTAAVTIDGLRDEGEATDFEATTTDLFHNQLPRFPHEVGSARERGESALVVAPIEHHDRVRELLSGRGLDWETASPRGGVEVVEGELERGFRLPPAAVSVYSEAQLIARRSPHRASRYRSGGPFFSGLRDLKVGEYVVHEDHGIGQFVGMRVLPGGGEDPELRPPALRELGPSASADVEVMELVYAGGRSLLLPVDRLHQIQRYSGIEGVSPRSDKLGGASWNKTKSRIKRGLRKLATDLLRLYAERELAQAPKIDADTDALSQFEAAFEFEETPDQLEAIRSIKADLERTRPMDRLLCGDVGFGKTEVAMRAAFKVVESGYQVAVLAPTTILADQHLETFTRRFAPFPMQVDVISRFRSSAEIRELRQRLAEGKIDILVGTHRLLSQDVEFLRLGLLVVDEEQRFGVAQKERLKELRKNVHVLAMSATPVPRTLQLSLAGVRDMSVIESPPKDRMAIETRILSFTPELVREAIEFEIERGGQVYYVYNRVETIEGIVSELREIVPDLRITVGHGQMDERELARRMHAFKAGEFDVLVSTTIIENGIDIPNVNTMIVHRADRFGLAQLYQLRGRVGRSSQLAYCYLLVPEDVVLSEDARKRLQALREFTALGAGFRIAARDLEIRGAGNLLGAEQSGHIVELGIETYLRMLEDTVRELRGEAPRQVASATIDLPVPMSIPTDYIADTNLRMEAYRRLGSGEEPMEEVLAELRDRFGPPPENVLTLVKVAALKHLAEGLLVQSISARSGRLTIRLRRDARVDVEALIRFVSEREGATFSPSGVLTLDQVPGADALTVARQTLDRLAAERELVRDGAVREK